MKELDWKTTRRILLSLSLVSAILFFCVLLFFTSNTSNEMEDSIFTGIGSLGTIGLFMAIGISFFVTSQFCLSKSRERDRLILRNLSIIETTLFVAIFLLLPIARGYLFFGRDDMLTHVGFCKDILINGRINSGIPIISTGDTYPIHHLLVSETDLLTNLDLFKVLMFLPVISYILFALGFASLGRKIYGKSDKSLIISLIGIIPFLSINMTSSLPSSLSMSFIPLALYLMVATTKIKSWSYITVILILLIMYPFLHPYTTLLLIIAFFIFGRFAFRKEIQNSPPNSLDTEINERSQERSRFKINYIGVLATMIFTLWFLCTSLIWTFKYVTLLILPGKEGILFTTLSKVGDLGLSFLDIMSIIIRSVGAEIILILLGVTAIILILTNRYHNVDRRRILPWAVIFITISTVGLITILIPSSVDVWRVITISSIFSVVIVGHFLALIMRKSNNDSYSRHIDLRRTSIALFLTMIICLSLLSCLRSPLAMSPTGQCLESEFVGVDWANHNMPYGSNLFKITSYERFSDANDGVLQSFFSIMKNVMLIPPHLDFKKDQFDKNGTLFLVTGEYDIQTYLGPWAISTNLNASEIIALSNNSTTGEIFDNGSIWIYHLYY